MRRLLLISLLVSANALAQQSVADNVGALHTPDKAWQTYARLQLWAVYDAIPVREFDSDWSVGYAPRDGRNLFLQRNRAEFGVEKDGWRVGVEYRLEGSLDASRDTLEFYRFYKQRLRPDGARDFNLNPQFRSWSAAGLRVARTFALGAAAGNGPLLMVSGALYANPRNRDIDVTGKVNYTPTDVYGFNAQYQESDTRYRYPFMPDQSQTSSGASVSLALQWPLSERLTANLALNDIWSRMRWSNLPAVRKNINSAVTSYDQDGYVNYQPLLSGQNSQIDKTGAIGASGAVSLSYQLELWTMKIGLDRIEATTIPAVSVAYRSPWGVFSTSYETRFNTLGVGYDHGPFSLHLRANRWPLNEASAIGLDAGVHYAF